MDVDGDQAAVASRQLQVWRGAEQETLQLPATLLLWSECTLQSICGAAVYDRCDGSFNDTIVPFQHIGVQ